jgi:hypothetical protein
MRCGDVKVLLGRLDGAEGTLQQRLAHEHLRGCATCRDAAHALRVLEAEAARSVPLPDGGAFERAMLVSARAVDSTERRNRAGFWRGAALGGAVAACLVAAALLNVPVERGPGSVTPVVSIAPNAVHDVRISLDSPESLDEAGITVTLSGAIVLRGYEDRRELSWSTPLDRGANELSLPVVALGPGGGQLLVEVVSGTKRKTFLIDVRADASI